MPRPPRRYRKKSSSSSSPFVVVNNDDEGDYNDNPPALQSSSDAPPATEPAAAGRGNSKPNNFNNKVHSFIPEERRSLWPSDFIKSATIPINLIKRNWQEERLHLLAVFGLVLALYAFTTPRLVTLEDDGLFIANLKFFGVAHPPGYPIHTFLGGIFYHLLPIGTPAFKGHFFSGFVGAIACAAIYAATIMIVRGRVFGYLAGVAYGASRTFWSQAIIAEVYTLNAMFFFIVFALCLHYSSHRGPNNRSHNKTLYYIAFIYGLGVANHYPLLGLGTTGLFILVLSQWKHILTNIHKAGCFFVLGAVPPYVWMVWRSLTETPASFYGPIESWDNLRFYILRSGYSGVDNQEGVGIEEKIAFTKFLSDEMLWQFTPLGLAFILVGVAVMARTRYNWLWVCMLASWFSSSVLLIYLLDFKAEFIWFAAFKVYHLLAYGFMAVWLAIGAAWVVDRLPKNWLKAKNNIAGLITIAVVAASVAAHWEVNNRRHYSWAHDLALSKLQSIEPNAILFLFDDLDLPVGYLHYVEGVRDDLTVYNDQGLVYGKRLYTPFIPDKPIPGHKDNKQAKIRELIETSPRPIYHHPQRKFLYEHPRYGSDTIGFFMRVNRDGKFDRVIFSDSIKDWLDKNLSIGDDITDLWTKQQHYGTITQAVSAVQLANLNGFRLDDTWLEILDRARDSNLHVRIITAANLINSQTANKEQLRDELLWLENFDIDNEELTNKQTRGAFYNIKATLVRLLDGEEDPKYEEYLLIGMAQFPDAENPVVRELIQFYVKQERFCDAKDLINSMYKLAKDIPKDFLRTVRQVRKKSASCPVSKSKTDS